jgi:hypothetical protein
MPCQGSFRRFQTPVDIPDGTGYNRYNNRMIKIFADYCLPVRYKKEWGEP